MSDPFDAALARLRDGARYSEDKPEETPETTALALWLAAAGAPCAVDRARPPRPDLTAAQAGEFELLVRRRLAGEPLAYLTGRQSFLSLELIAAPGALIPRRETELLAAGVLGIAREMAATRAPVKILDLGTGSGNIAVALAAHEPRVQVWATDLEREALAVAARNVALLGVGDRVALLQGDLFGALAAAEAPPGFDIVVCNPPYIPSAKAKSMPTEVGGFEPAAAFDGGDFGLNILLRLVAEAPRHLAAGGWLGFEVGAGQGPFVARRIASHGGYAEVRPLADAAGTTRALLAHWPGAA